MKLAPENEKSYINLCSNESLSIKVSPFNAKSGYTPNDLIFMDRNTFEHKVTYDFSFSSASFKLILRVCAS